MWRYSEYFLRPIAPWLIVINAKLSLGTGKRIFGAVLKQCCPVKPLTNRPFHTSKPFFSANITIQHPAHHIFVYECTRCSNRKLIGQIFRVHGVDWCPRGFYQRIDSHSAQCNDFIGLSAVYCRLDAWMEGRRAILQQAYSWAQTHSKGLRRQGCLRVQFGRTTAIRRLWNTYIRCNSA